MATTDATPKASPDVNKLTNMQRRVVTIMKVRRGGASAAVIPFWDNPSVEQLMTYQNDLPKTSGPGVYKFDVADPSTNERESWTVQLGDVTEAPMPAAPIPFAGGSMNVSAGGQVGPDGSIQLGHGYQ